MALCFFQPTAVMALPEPLAKEQTIGQERGGAGGERREGRKLTMIFQTGQCTMKLKTIRQGTPGGGPRQTKQGVWPLWSLFQLRY